MLGTARLITFQWGRLGLQLASAFFSPTWITDGMADAKQVRVLVADSGAFIKHAPLEKWSPKVVTVKEVLSELRDDNTRRRLQASPFEVHFREPTLSSIQHGSSK